MSEAKHTPTLDPMALTMLTEHQRQLDIDGCEVGVSRQALDEVLADHTSLRTKLAEAERALEPFAKVAEHDIGTDESDKDIFRPMMVLNRVARLTVGDLRSALRALSSIRGEKAADEWIEWKGGECPVGPETQVKVGQRTGNTDTGKAWQIRWSHTPDSGDIIAYRVVTP